MKRCLIAQGAEALLYKENNILIKKRIKKSYRLSKIDEKIRKLRTRRESKILKRLEGLDFVPSVLEVDEKNKIIKMDFIEGELVRDILNEIGKKKREEICKQIGENIAKMHNLKIIHGDLTTSNFILKDKKVYFIDFGLSFVSERIEDKAVDLHLLKQALESKHYKCFECCFEKVLEGYRIAEDYNKVVDRLRKVEARGRYKSKFLK